MIKKRFKFWKMDVLSLTTDIDNDNLELHQVDTKSRLTDADGQDTLPDRTAPRYRVSIVAPTCFYYQVDLFRKLANEQRIDLTVYFCSDEAINARDILEMYNTEAHWGAEEELLHGFKHQFLRNFSPAPSYLKWPFGLMNFGIWKKIRDHRPDVVILMSWMNATWWIAIVACLFYDVPILFLTDANGDAEPQSVFWKRAIKKIILGNMLFPRVAGFLCAGTANREFYSLFGVPEEIMVPFAYSWGYDYFLQSAQKLKSEKARLRNEFSIPADSKVVLYCGRLSEEKNLVHLLEAYCRVESNNKALIFVGDGDLSKQMEDYVADHNLESVQFMGFQSRNDLPNFYAIADVLVLPSRRETWGMVVNEAMCFGLPIIVSDQVGAGRDLVRDGYNGFIFPVGEIPHLARHIRHLVGMPTEELALMGRRSIEMITQWNNQELGDALLGLLDRTQTNNKKGAKP